MESVNKDVLELVPQEERGKGANIGANMRIEVIPCLMRKNGIISLAREESAVMLKVSGGTMLLQVVIPAKAWDFLTKEEEKNVSGV